MKKIAVVLFNLGGPDSPEAVKPFLFSLFNDPAIINYPQPFRCVLAFIISTMRTRKAKAIYEHIGGKSPILEQTTAQAEALEKRLRANSPDEYKVFVCMRHWNPKSDLVVKKVKAYAPGHIILLPLYPQFSTTTTGSSFSDWKETAKKNHLDVPTSSICCYANDHSFVAAHVKLIKDMYWKAAEDGKPKILFSAHGLPEKIIASGDPYQWQVEKSVASIVQVLAVDQLDYSICYQSKIGRLNWIGPSTAEEIIAAGKNKVPVVIVPISFVSEHSETLVELDIDYANLAKENGLPGYWRVPTLGVDEFFIEMLSDLCLSNDKHELVDSSNKTRLCPRNLEKCLCAA